MNGLLGLANSINTREGATQELASLERMDQMVQQDKKNEQMAQYEQMQFFERMHQTADQMLEKDRKKINKQIAVRQKQIRDHLSEFGGSKQDFMNNGGRSVLNNSYNEILRSDEAIQYQENKKNLAKILEAKEKGMGHLLSPSDLRSLEEYENNPEGGKITYSGIMAEVEIPPSQNFDYGSEISPYHVMSYNTNMMKILGNYKVAYPDRPEPDFQTREGYEQIVAFMKKMGYGGMGSNTTRLREQAAMQKKRMEYEAKNSTKKGAPNSLLHGVSETLKMIPNGLTVRELNEKYQGGYLDDLAKDNGAVSQVFDGEFKHRSRRRSAGGVHDGNDGIGELIDYFGQDMMGLRDAKKLALTQKDQDTLVKELMGTYMDESGMIRGFEPDGSTVYAADGTIIDQTTFGNGPEAYKGDYKVLGITTAMKSAVKNGKNGQESVLLVNAYDDDGTFDKKSTDKLYKNRFGDDIDSEVGMTMVLAMEGKEGDVIYKEVNLDQPGIIKALENSIASTNDITDVVDRRNETEAVKRQVKKLDAEEQVVFEGAQNTVQPAFDSPLFKTEGENFWGTGSGGQQNRNRMMKAFYMSADFMRNMKSGQQKIARESIQQAVDKEMFTTAMITGGVEENLKNYAPGNSEHKIIDTWLENMNNDPELSEGQKQNNAEMAMKWKQFLDRL